MRTFLIPRHYCKMAKSNMASNMVAVLLFPFCNFSHTSVKLIIFVSLPMFFWSRNPLRPFLIQRHYYIMAKYNMADNMAVASLFPCNFSHVTPTMNILMSLPRFIGSRNLLKVIYFTRNEVIIEKFHIVSWVVVE